MLILSTLAVLIVIGGYRLLAFPGNDAVPASLSAVGDEGERVVELQTRLMERGYDTGGITGQYDWRTAEAVRQFQRDAGLDPSGRLNPETGMALGFSQELGDIQRYEEERFLASTLDAVCPEAPYLVKVALAGLCYRRQSDAGFPDDMPSIVFGDPAFYETLRHDFTIEPTSEAWRAVRDAANGMSPCPEALYFYRREKADDFFLRLRTVFRNGRYCFAVPEETADSVRSTVSITTGTIGTSRK